MIRFKYSYFKFMEVLNIIYCKFRSIGKCLETYYIAQKIIKGDNTIWHVVSSIYIWHIIHIFCVGKPLYSVMLSIVKYNILCGIIQTYVSKVDTFFTLVENRYHYDNL